MVQFFAAPLPRHRAFYLTFALGAVVLVGALWLAPALAIQLGADTFFASYILLLFWQMPKLNPDFLSGHADEQDAPATLIFLITIGMVAISAWSLFALLNGPANLEIQPLLLSIASVLLGWFALNGMWAMHYAYEYYEADQRADDDQHKAKKRVLGGLDFPGPEQPDGWAFLYFSFVLGMTAQTSDVAVTANKMRRIVLMHGIFAFLFNAVIVAAAVNIVVSLGN